MYPLPKSPQHMVNRQDMSYCLSFKMAGVSGGTGNTGREGFMAEYK